MSPFKVLGLTRRASLQEVKRAYAQLLKKHRPDEDPVGFQRIHEAFEACVARCKERDARERELAQAGPPTDFDAEESGDAIEAGANGDAPHERDDGDRAWSLDRPEPPAPGESAAEAELGALHEELVDRMLRDSPQAIEDWLSRDERLYAPSRKRALCARLLADANDLDYLKWQQWDAVFRFFELDSISDPRLSDDYFARRLWLQVREDERFQQQLDRLRAGKHDNFADRQVRQELFDPPRLARTLFLLAVPGLANRLRKRYDELAAADLARTEAAVAPRMHSLWLPLTDASRLDWRRFALAYGQMAVLAAAVIGLFAGAAGNGWGDYLRITAILCAFFVVPWTGWTLLRWGWRRYVAWRVDRYGEGEAPAGASFFADQLSVMVAAILVCVLLTWAAAWRWGGQGLGFLVHGFALMVALRMQAGDAQRQRWEAYLLWMMGTACAWRLLSAFAASDYGWDPSFLVPASTLGVALVVVADYAEARRRGLPPSEARQHFGTSHAALAVAAILGLVGIIAAG